MSKLTKQHFIAAAEEISNGRHSLWKTGRERLLLVKFCIKFFKQWNPEFDTTRFEEACNEGVPARKTGGLKRALKKYTHPESFGQPPGYERPKYQFPDGTPVDGRERLKRMLRGEVRVLRTMDIKKCRFVILAPEHYRDDGSCKCDDPEHREMMIREWEYTPDQFEGIPLRQP